VLENDNGTFVGRAVTNALPSPRFVATGDLNRDGLPDIVTASVTGNTVQMFLNNGTTNFAGRGITLPMGAVGPRQILLADVDNDRDLDILVASLDNNQLLVHVSSCCQRFQPCQTECSGGRPLAFETTLRLPLSGARSVAVGDMNGDGLTDIVGGGDGLSVFLQSGSSFTPLAVLANSSFLDIIAVDTGDVNRDGRMDIVLSSLTQGAILTLINNGQNSFTSTQLGAAPGVLALAIEDLTQSGTLGVVVGVRDNNIISFFPQAAGGSALRTLATNIPSPRDLVLVDVDGDGDEDVSWGRERGSRGEGEGVRNPEHGGKAALLIFCLRCRSW
jgi:hypothetical protein